MSERQGHDVADVLVSFSRSLSDGQSVEEVLLTLGDFCTELLAVDGIGILLVREGRLVVATANSELGDVAEHLEAELAEGPCTDSIRTSRHVLAPDLHADVERWPDFAPRALAAGIRGIHAIPMGGRSDHPIGSVDIVTGALRTLTEQELRIADMLTEVAVAYIVSVQAREEATELATQLEHALHSRIVIEQAKGILAGRHGVPLSVAFDSIRHHARSHRDKIHDVAKRICDGELDPM